MLIKEFYENLDFKHGLMMNLSYDKIPEAFPLHWHIFAEILVSFDDSFEMVIGHDTFTLHKNDIAICFPGDLHAINYKGKNSFMILQFPFELISNMKEFNRIMYLFNQSHHIRFDSSLEASVKMKDILWDMKEIYYGRAPFKEVLLFTHLLSFFAVFGNDCLKTVQTQVADSAGRRSTELITEACVYIAQNCNQPLELESVAKHIGFSKYHFAHMFKQYVNMTFLEFLTKQRIKRAEKLLVDPHVSITEIAFRTGYTSFSTFNRTFKKIKGCTPSEFRNKISQLG